MTLPAIQPVSFSNRDGRTMVGMVHEPPPGVRRDVAIVLLSPGVKSRVAPHRLYNKWSQCLAEQGHLVLRFDFFGLGDSEGVINEPLLQDFYGSVQVGRYVEDTLAAIDWLNARYGSTRFVLGGLCGGAITGVLAAVDDPRVVGILGLALPVMLQGSNIDPRRYLTTGQLESIRKRYLRKAGSPRAWLRFMTLRTDYRLLAKSMARWIRGGRSAGVNGAPLAAQATNLNPLLPGALEQLFSRGCRVLLLFGEADRLYWEYQEKYVEHQRHVVTRHRALLETHVIPGANHILTLQEWQSACFKRSQTWLEAFTTPAPDTTYELCRSEPRDACSA